MLKNKDLRNRRSRRGYPGCKKGFTLLEAMYASAILSIMSLATIQAVTAGQQQSIAAQNQLIAVLVARSTMNELAVTDYSVLPTFDGRTDDIGTVTTLQGGVAYPSTAENLGRSISVVSDSVTLTDPPITINGYTATVEVYDEKRVLSSVSRFFPEPAS